MSLRERIGLPVPTPPTQPPAPVAIPVGRGVDPKLPEWLRRARGEHGPDERLPVKVYR